MRSTMMVPARRDCRAADKPALFAKFEPDMDKKQRLFEVFRAGRWFQQLPTGFQEQLVAAGAERRLGKNEVLFSRGDPPSGLFGVVDGAIRITAPALSASTSARDTLLALVEAPMWFGEIA